jgi:hypothetical protein
VIVLGEAGDGWAAGATGCAVTGAAYAANAINIAKTQSLLINSFLHKPHELTRLPNRP